MHEGKVLQKLVHDDDRKVMEIAAKAGMSRGYLYILYKQAQIDPIWKKRFSDIGIVVDSTNVHDGQKVSPHSGSNGIPHKDSNQKHIQKSQIGDIDLLPPNPFSVSAVISMSLTDLLRLQREQDDVELLKAVNQMIQLRKDIEHLEKENKRLERDNEWLKKQLDKAK